MHRDPLRELHNFAYPVETPVARMIIRHGVVRLAYSDPEEAMVLWELFKRRYEFFGEDDNYVLRWVGILAAQAQSPAGGDVAVGGFRRCGRRDPAPVAGAGGDAQRGMGTGLRFHRGLERGAAARQPMALLDRAHSRVHGQRG